jgi:hypothetical protein
MPINLPNPSDIFSLLPIGVNDSGSGTSGSNQITDTSPQIVSNAIVEGKITDESGNPLSGVGVTFIQVPTSDLIKPINKKVTTNKNGEWSFTFPKTDIDPKSVEILYLKHGYGPASNTLSSTKTTEFPTQPLQVVKTSTPETEPPYVFTVGNEEFSSSDLTSAQSKANAYYAKATDPKYSSATIFNVNKTLTVVPKIEELNQSMLKTYIDPISSQIRELERLKNLEKAKEDLPPFVKVSLSINVQKEEIKKILIPYIFKLLAPFGVEVIQSILADISIEKLKDLILCPRQDKILQLINKRNKLVKKINNIYNTVNTTTKMLDIASALITGLQVGITATVVLPVPIVAAVSVALEKATSELRKSKIILNILELTLSALGVVLGFLLKLLSKLDFLLRDCSQSQNIPYEAINDELNTIVNQATGVSNSQVIQNVNEKLEYKGFTLELKLDESNTNKYPKRYAQALTVTGVPVLKTDSSFASEPQVLLDQLRFLIDSNPDLNAG